jgi:hypothetical protein
VAGGVGGMDVALSVHRQLPHGAAAEGREPGHDGRGRGRGGGRGEGRDRGGDQERRGAVELHTR